MFTYKKLYVLTGTVNKNISFRKTLICNLDVSLCVIFVGISSQLTLSNTGWVLVLLGLTSEILHPFKLLIPLDLMYSTVQGIIQGIIMEGEREREREREYIINLSNPNRYFINK